MLFLLRSPLPQRLPTFGVSSSSRSGRTTLAVVPNATLGRGTGGIHGHRGKGRRRRLRKPDQDDTPAPASSDEDDENGEASKAGRGRKLRRRSSKLEESQQAQQQQQQEEVAPVAMTVLTDPDLFPSGSEEAGTGTDTAAGGAGEAGARAASEGGDGQVIEQVSSALAEQVQSVLPETVVVQAGQVAEQVSHVVEQIAAPVVDQVTQAAAQVVNLLTHDQEGQEEEEEEGGHSDDEFEAYTTSDLPDFRGVRGLENFQVLQEKSDVLTLVYDVYIFMLKQPLPNFTLAMLAAPVVISGFFTLLYLPQLQGLALDDTARQFVSPGPQELNLSWPMVFQVFMFSLSLSTGLQPELAPLTPYTLVVANLNALVAQLVFVFSSGAVFARLSQPSQPIRCSPVALISPPPARKTRSSPSARRVFMTRYVLVGPQPCELVDVKVDLSYKYNTMTRTGSYFRATESLKLVRSEVAYLNHGMLVRHIIDDASPLKRRTPDMMRKEDAIFTLSVVGLERSSMQPVFHAQHYSVNDDHVIWDAEFEDMILINKKNRRIVDHSRLSLWRHIG